MRLFSASEETFLAKKKDRERENVKDIASVSACRLLGFFVFFLILIFSIINCLWHCILTVMIKKNIVFSLMTFCYPHRSANMFLEYIFNLLLLPYFIYWTEVEFNLKY